MRVTKINEYSTYINFIRNKEAQRKDKDNIFCTGISDTEFVKFAIKYLLGDDWYVVDPLGYSQITQLALEDILFKYSKQFKKEYKKAKEDKMRATKINEYSKNKKTSKSKNPYKRVISNIRNYGYEYVSNKKQVTEITKLLREDERLIAYVRNNFILVKIMKGKLLLFSNEEKVIWIENVHDIYSLE